MISQWSFLNELGQIADVKANLDLAGTWFKGSESYLQAILEEVDEVRTEIEANRQCYLEDELGDLLWNFVCILSHLDKQNKIDKDKVYSRSIKKYKERVLDRTTDETWESVKHRQKLALKQELLSETDS